MKEQLGNHYPIVITGESGVRKLNLLMEKGWYLDNLDARIGASPIFFVPVRAVLPLLNPEEVPAWDEQEPRKRPRPLMLLLTHGKGQTQRAVLVRRDAGGYWDFATLERLLKEEGERWYPAYSVPLNETGRLTILERESGGAKGSLRILRG
ncbi:MAG: hypothetical protein ABI876_12520 [Bacteroidota bacterium]